MIAMSGSGPLGAEAHIAWLGQPAHESAFPAVLDSGPGQCSGSGATSFGAVLRGLERTSLTDSGSSRDGAMTGIDGGLPRAPGDIGEIRIMLGASGHWQCRWCKVLSIFESQYNFESQNGGLQYAISKPRSGNLIGAPGGEYLSAYVNNQEKFWSFHMIKSTFQYNNTNKHHMLLQYACSTVFNLLTPSIIRLLRTCPYATVTEEEILHDDAPYIQDRSGK